MQICAARDNSGFAKNRLCSAAEYPPPVTTARKTSLPRQKRWRMKNLGLALIFACVVVPASTLAQNAYIRNSGANTVSVIATATNTVVGSPIPVGAAPFGVAVTPDGTKAYVAHDSTPGAVSVIDIATNMVVGSQIPVSAPAVVVAVAPDGSKVYVTTAIRAGRGTGGVSVIEAATNTVIATIFLDRVNDGVAVTPDGRKVYVAANPSGHIGRPANVSVVDAATNAVIATVPVGFSPFGVAVTADGSKVYVASSGSNTVSVIDAATNAVIATVPVGLGAAGVAVT